VAARCTSRRLTLRARDRRAVSELLERFGSPIDVTRSFASFDGMPGS